MKFLYATIAAAMLFITPAYAQSNGNCGTSEQAQELVNEYKEILIASYVDDKGNGILIYGNIDSGTATVFLSPRGREGMICIISSGEKFQVGPRSENRSYKKSRDAYPQWKGDVGEAGVR